MMVNRLVSFWLEPITTGEFTLVVYLGRRKPPKRDLIDDKRFERCSSSHLIVTVRASLVWRQTIKQWNSHMQRVSFISIVTFR